MHRIEPAFKIHISRTRAARDLAGLAGGYPRALAPDPKEGSGFALSTSPLRGSTTAYCLYIPHVHNLRFLRTQAERIDPRLTYVKAHYSKHYRITAEELA